MRTLCVSLITAVLLASVPVGVAAQSDEEAPTFTFVTGKVIKDNAPEEDWEETRWVGNVGHVLGWRVERSIEWSDPRLPAEMVSRLNYDFYPGGPDLLQPMAETYRLDGPDGAWTGTGRGFAVNATQQDWMVSLSGEGAYEGLSAMLVREIVRADPDSDGSDHEWFSGYVFKGDLPSMPDPIQPAAE